MIPVNGYSGLYRDDITQAIITKNDNSYNEYLKIKDRLTKNQKRIDHLESELTEIKEILKNLISNK